MQSELRLMASMQGAPRRAPDALVRRLDSEADAIAVAMKMAGAKLAFVAASMGVTEATVSMWRSGKRCMRDPRVRQFCITTGTTLLRQYRDLQRALALIDADETVERKHRIEQLAQMGIAA